MMLDSSPGMVSSLITGQRPATPDRISSTTARRTSSGSAAKLGARLSSWAYSGNMMRAEVM
jgi:hypothetical protein